MSKSMSFLAELQKLKPRFPEVQFEVPEWGRPVVLRALSVREGRELAAANADADNEKVMLLTLAYAIVNEDERPLANPEGAQLLETLSTGTISRMARAFMQLNELDEAAEKNSAAGVSDGSSSSLPSRSDGQLMN